MLVLPRKVSRAVDVRGEGRVEEYRELLEYIESFGSAEIRQLVNIARVMSRPIEETVSPDSDLVGEKFASEFRARLLAHHGTHTTGMDRLAFEAALTAAAAQEGRRSEPAPSKTTRFWDVRIGDEQVSAKTSSAKNMKRDVIEVSKLSEAAWIQDMRSARDRHAKTLALFRDFVQAVQRWLVLRIFETSDGFTYELVEIPMSFFGPPVQNLMAHEFDSDGPRITVSDSDGRDLFVLVLDRSDSKVTLKKIDKGNCLVHATWVVPKSVAVEG